MDNPVREFAEVVRKQLNKLIHWNEIDHEIFELDFEGWEEHGGIAQWTRQDQRRLRNALLIQRASPLELRDLPMDDGRTNTRVSMAFRLFKLESQVVQARQKAFEFCGDKPQFSSVPSVISAMSIAHRKWKQAMKMQHDDAIWEARQVWDDAFDDLFDWIDEIESYEDWAPKPTPVTDDFEEGWKAAEQAFNDRIREVIAQKIPAEKRSPAMSKKEVLNYIGRPAHAVTDRQAEKWLNDSIEDNELRCEIKNRKSYYWHLDDIDRMRAKVKS